MGTITNAERHRLARLYGMSPADLGCRDEPAPIALSHVGTEGEPELKNWLALRRSAGCPPPTAAELAGWYSLQKRIAVNPENLPMAKRGAVDLSEYSAPAGDAHAQQLSELKSNAIRLLRKFVSDNPSIPRDALVAEIASQLTEFATDHPGSISAADLKALPTEIVNTALKAMPDSSGTAVGGLSRTAAVPASVLELSKKFPNGVTFNCRGGFVPTAGSKLGGWQPAE